MNNLKWLIYLYFAPDVVGRTLYPIHRRKLYLRHRNGLPQITQMTTDFISG